MMADHDDIAAEDRDLFRQAAGPVRPVRHDRVAMAPPRVAPKSGRIRAVAPAPPSLPSFQDAPDDPSRPDRDRLLFLRPGLQRRLLLRLQRGRLAIDAELDLHGMTVNEARSALLAFLERCSQRQVRCARIIHGRGLNSPHGRPVLKRQVNHWLQQWQSVLAFCSAPHEDGGTGATYVLLRRD